MKKTSLLALACLLIHSMHADDHSNEELDHDTARTKAIEQEIADFDSFVHENIDDIADDTGIIRITIMIYKDQAGHDTNDWKHLVTKTAETCSRLRSYELRKEVPLTVQQEMQTIINDLANNNEHNGIITEFTIETSDGMPSKGCCGDNCQCIERYRGNCPCSLNQDARRCFFPDEIPFDDQYQEDEDNNETDSSDSFENVDLSDMGETKKSCCCG